MHGPILAPPGRYPIQKAIADLRIFGPPDRALPLEGDAWMQRLSGPPLLAQGYGMAVVTEALRDRPAAGSFGWIGGYGSSWISPPGI